MVGKRSARRKKHSKKTVREVDPGPVNVIRHGALGIAIPSTLLRNLIDRDVRPVQKSFDRHFSALLAPIDDVFSDAATLLFMSTSLRGEDDNTTKRYRRILAGLTHNSLNTVGAAVILLRSGMVIQSMVLIRQAIEICSTIIHIVGDDSQQAITDFEAGTYNSNKSVTQAKKAVPVLGYFWGFLGSSFVHINQLHAELQQVKAYERDDVAVKAVLPSLRMAAWICYLSMEIAYPATRENRYWKLTQKDGRHALLYDPDSEQRKRAAEFLGFPDISGDELAADADLPENFPSPAAVT